MSFCTVLHCSFSLKSVESIKMTAVSISITFVTVDIV